MVTIVIEVLQLGVDLSEKASADQAFRVDLNVETEISQGRLFSEQFFYAQAAGGNMSFQEGGDVFLFILAKDHIHLYGTDGG